MGNRGKAGIILMTRIRHQEAAGLEVKCGRPPIVLMPAQADVNATAKDGWTQLHWAAFGDHKDVVKLLIAKGAVVNAKGKDGWTLLHWAALGGNKDVVELLKKHGAK